MKKKIKLAVFLIFISLIFAQEKSNTALVLIDIQDFYFPGGKSELLEPVKAAEKASELLKFFRAKSMEVIHIKHIAKSQGNINKIVAPLESEKVITKSEVSCFNGTDLLKYLKSKNIEKLVICGMMTHMCVEAAVRAGYDNGFEVVMIDDASATKDLEYNNQKINAKDVHNSTLATFQYYAKVMTVEQYLKEKSDEK